MQNATIGFEIGGRGLTVHDLPFTEQEMREGKSLKVGQAEI